VKGHRLRLYLHPCNAFGYLRGLFYFRGRCLDNIVVFCKFHQLTQYIRYLLRASSTFEPHPTILISLFRNIQLLFKMLFSLRPILLLSSLASSIVALPVESAPQDTVAVLATARNLQASFNNVLDAIKDMERFRTSSLLGEKTDWVLHHCKDLTNQFNHGISDIGRGPAITPSEISTLWGWNGAYDSLLTSIKSTSTAWIASRNTIVASGGKNAVASVLQEHRRLAKQFTDALNNKLPVTGQLYGSNFARSVASEFDRAINSFR
jgi:hypothetical protein